MAVVLITGHQQFSYTYSAHEGNLYFTALKSNRPLIYNFTYITNGVKYKDNSRLTKKMPALRGNKEEAPQKWNLCSNSQILASVSSSFSLFPDTRLVCNSSCKVLTWHFESLKIIILNYLNLCLQATSKCKAEMIWGG